MSLANAQRLKCDMRPVDSKLHMQTINNNAMSVPGEVRANVEVEEFRRRLLFYIVRSLSANVVCGQGVYREKTMLSVPMQKTWHILTMGKLLSHL